MLLFLLLGTTTLLSSGSAIPIPSSCVDSATHIFENDDALEVGCSWLTDDPIEEANRVAEYCPRPNVKYMCADTCNTCEEECEDNPVYVFRQLILNVYQNCSWISEIPSQIDIRREGYCDLVGIFCPDACGYCPEAASSPSDQPSMTEYDQPSASPSIEPSEQTSESPSSTPSSVPSKLQTSFSCTDSTSHTFLLDYNGVPAHCEWLTRNSKHQQARLDRYCPRPNVRYMCAESCSTCEEECTDDPSYRFNLINFPQYSRSCDWIVLNPNFIETRRQNYCADVGAYCLQSCGFCPNFETTTNPSYSPSLSGTPSSVPSYSSKPSYLPTMQPSSQPSTGPSIKSSYITSYQPSAVPSGVPSFAPSNKPSTTPSYIPSSQPSVEPTLAPSSSPTGEPSSSPSFKPTSLPSFIPSSQPSIEPTLIPTTLPSSAPTDLPSSSPSFKPTSLPTYIPSLQPSVKPSIAPTVIPSSTPSLVPSFAPSIEPTSTPSSVPSFTPQNCDDSPLMFWEGVQDQITCADFDLNKCDEPYFASHCPATCGKCYEQEYKCADSEAIFVHEDKLLYCEWLSDLDQSLIDQRCADDDIKLTCRSTCGYCGNVLINFDDVSLSDPPYYAEYTNEIMYMENIGAFHGEDFQSMFPEFPGISKSVVSEENSGAIYYPGDIALMVCPEGTFDMISLYVNSITGVATSVEIIAYDELYEFVDEAVILLTNDETSSVSLPSSFENIRAVSISNGDEVAIGLEDIDLFINSPCFIEEGSVSAAAMDFIGSFTSIPAPDGKPKTFLGFDYDSGGDDEVGIFW